MADVFSHWNAREKIIVTKLTNKTFIKTMFKNFWQLNQSLWSQTALSWSLSLVSRWWIKPCSFHTKFHSDRLAISCVNLTALLCSFYWAFWWMATSHVMSMFLTSSPLMERDIWCFSLWFSGNLVYFFSNIVNKKLIPSITIYKKNYIR